MLDAPIHEVIRRQNEIDGVKDELRRAHEQLEGYRGLRDQARHAKADEVMYAAIEKVGELSTLIPRLERKLRELERAQP